MVAPEGLVDVLVQGSAGATAVSTRGRGLREGQGSSAGRRRRVVGCAGGVGALRAADACGAWNGRVGARGA